MQHVTFPAVFMRGGTSKGVFFRGGVLPADPAVRDAILLSALGSPDPYRRQIDGLGGASSSTSKAVIVSRSERPGFDVDYLFAQVSVESPVVDYTATCGNLSSAVGPFAISEGMIPALEGTTVVKIWQVNVNRPLIAYVPVKDGEPCEEGDFMIDGLPFGAAEIKLEYPGPGGAVTGKLFPSGNAIDEIAVEGAGKLAVSLVDAATPVVFFRARDLGLRGTELRPDVDNDPALLQKLENVRAAGSVAMGITRDLAAAHARTGTPKLAFVAPATAYRSASGREIARDDIDLVVRAVSMGTLHHAIPGTVAIATAIAAALPGTIPNEAAGLAPAEEQRVRFGHTSGIIEIGAGVAKRDGEWFAEKAVVSRSARRIMQGEVCIPASIAAPRVPALR